VAAELLQRFGLARLTMEDVARGAGIARPTLYKHFASRDDLVAELMAQEIDTRHAPVMHELAGEAPTVAGFVDLFLKHLELGRAFALFDPVLDPASAPRAAELVFGSGAVAESVERLWMPILDRYEEAGVLRSGLSKPAVVRWLSYQQFWLIVHPTVLCGDDPVQLRYYVERFIVGGVVRQL
jgi:AcrR family transcriptional regulator